MGPLRRWYRVQSYTRGKRKSRPAQAHHKTTDDRRLQFGNETLPSSVLTNHFLFAGTSGSGKTLLQRRLLKNFLLSIQSGSDSRCLILDAKNDIVPFLKKINVTCPVYSLNPFESRDLMLQAVAWDVAVDVTTPAEALNFSAGIFPEEKDGTNRFWTDSARLVVASVLESFIRHTPGEWRFCDLVCATLSLKRITAVLSRDEQGVETLDNFFFDEDVAYKVFTTVASRLSYYRPVAALWQRLPRNQKLSIREWLAGESILLLGVNATSRRALDVLNELLFRTVVQEVDMLPNSHRRKIVLWLDEARLAGPLLRRDLLPYYAVKSRSKGGSLILSFQDIDGFRDACGSDQVANEIVAQCSYKTLGRLESEESARWASGLCGQYETINWLRSEHGRLFATSQSLAEQRIQTAQILPAEFYSFPVPNRAHGVSAVFLTPQYGRLETVRGDQLDAVVITEHEEPAQGSSLRQADEQWLRAWTKNDCQRLLLDVNGTQTKSNRGKLRLKRNKEIPE